MNIHNLRKILHKKGVIETSVYGLELVLFKINSILKITAFRLRGYDIDNSVFLKGVVFFFQSTLHAIRISHGCVIGKHVRLSCGQKGKIHIGANVLVDDFTYIMAHENIQIGKNTQIASFCFITDFNHKYDNTTIPLASQGYKTKPVVIGENVWIGTHVIILPGVIIGKGSVIGAGSIVTKNIPAHCIAVGNPARVIKVI